MTGFRGYTHVERLGKSVVENILEGVVSVQPKLDGTNGCVWSDGETVFVGSRTRYLDPTEVDNAGFRKYITTSDDVEVAALREFVKAHPDYTVYGEWLGGIDNTKFTGSIKQYIEGGFWVFDIYDHAADDYLTYSERSAAIGDIYHRCVPEFCHGKFTVDDLTDVIENNHFNLPANVVGEGIVIKGEPSYRDVYGHIQIAKIVRDEFHARKSAPKKVYGAGELEAEFVDTYMTSAFIDKELNKIRLALGMEDIDTKNGKFIGYAMSAIPNTCIEENIVEFIKKRKNPVLDFSAINGKCKIAVRDFMGL